MGSAALVLSVTIPQAERSERGGSIYDNTTRGIRIYLATPRLRGLLALNLSVVAAGAMVIVNTVVIVRGLLTGTDSDVAIALAFFGGGSMTAALLLPRLLDRMPDALLCCHRQDVFWSHRGELCTFDVMIEEFGLSTPPLDRLAIMVRAADTGRPELSPEAPGLLAASLGLSRMYDDDLEQLEAGMLVYDAFYRWCRDATGETHNWPTNKGKS